MNKGMWIQKRVDGQGWADKNTSQWATRAPPAVWAGAESRTLRTFLLPITNQVFGRLISQCVSWEIMHWNRDHKYPEGPGR